MAFVVKIKSPDIRVARIKSSLAATDDLRDFYDFRNQKTRLKFIRIAEDLLLYRMENFRTYTEQHAYIIREKLPADFFLASQENESAQQIQHEILSQLAKRGRSDSIPVIEVLRTERQREPLLITHRGIVVNGNRRLAGMRELLEEDRTANQDFAYVDCLVLPEDATPEDIVDIEASLQAKPETKLDYDWVGESQLIKKLLELGRTEKQVADRLNRRPKDVRNAVAALAEANLYLKDWAHSEDDYTQVREDAEQLFKDLPDLVQGKDQDLADASRAIAWTLLENRKQLSERLYAFNIAFGKRAPDVLDRISSELGIPLIGEGPADDGSFDVDIDADSERVSYQPIVDLFRDPDRKEDVVEALIDICSAVVEEERGRKSSNAALKALVTAHSKLTAVDLGRAEKATYAPIDRQLDQIIKRASELKTTISRLLAPQVDKDDISKRSE